MKNNMLIKLDANGEKENFMDEMVRACTYENFVCYDYKRNE